MVAHLPTAGARIAAQALDAVVSLACRWAALACVVVWFAGGRDTHGWLVAAVLLLLVALAETILCLAMTARHGTTPGKRIMGLRVVDARTGQPIGWWRAVVRHVVVATLTGVSCGVLGLVSVLVAGTEPRRRAWQDLAADTVVLSTR